MDFDIVPTVKYEDFKDGKKGYLATAATPTINRLEYVMEEVKRFGVFSFKKMAKTQIAYWPNPGFNLEQLQSLLVPAIYVAERYQNLNDFWKVGVVHHEQIYTIVVYFHGAIVRENVRLVLNSWILAKAKIDINNQYRDCIPGHGPDRNLTSIRIGQAKHALTGLEFLDPRKVIISRSEVGKRIKEIKSLIQKLEEDHALLCRLADKSDQASKLAKEFKDDYFKTAGKIASATPELYLRYRKTMDDFELLGHEMDRLASRFDKNRGAAIMSRIGEITPA